MRRWPAVVIAVVVSVGLAVAPAGATPSPQPEPPRRQAEPPPRPGDDPPRSTAPPAEPSDVLDEQEAASTLDRALEEGTQAAPVTNRVVGDVLAAGGSAVVRDAALATVGSVTDRSRARAGGSNRYGTAVVLSAKTFAPGTSEVWLASGENFPDGLSASAIAGARRGPVLLTTKTSLPGSVSAELVRLAPTNVWIVGGTGVISDGVMNAVRTAVPSARVGRVAGQDRFATAAALSAKFVPSSSSAFIANGFGFPDALGAGPAAALKGAPTLLVTASSIPSATRTELSRLKPSTGYIAGGTGVVADSVASTIRSITGGQVVRVAGANRYATAAAIADRFFRPTTDRVVLASGLAFPDGLSAGAVAGASGSPLLLVDGNAAPPRVTLDSARRVSWWLPDEGRVLRYTVVVHPDDDLSAWSLVGRPDPRRYDVIIVLTRGESSSYCNGRYVSNAWSSQQYLPQPQPTGLQYSDRCAKHRMDSWRAFMDGTALGPVGPWERLTSGPANLNGRVLPTPQRRSATGDVEPADYFDLHVGPDAAYVSFDMGPLLTDEVLWAIQTTRGLADRFPTQLEGDVIGAGFFNDTDQGYAYEHADHHAMYTGLGRNDLGLPGSQYAAVGHAQPSRAFGATVSDYCGLMCHPAAPSAFRGSMGRFQWAFGWLAAGYWVPGSVDARAGFSRYQSFAKWY